MKIGEAATGIGEHMADIGLAVQRAQDIGTTRHAAPRLGNRRKLDYLEALDDPMAQGDDP